MHAEIDFDGLSKEERRKWIDRRRVWKNLFRAAGCLSTDIRLSLDGVLRETIKAHRRPFATFKETIGGEPPTINPDEVWG